MIEAYITFLREKGYKARRGVDGVAILLTSKGWGVTEALRIDYDAIPADPDETACAARG